MLIIAIAVTTFFVDGLRWSVPAFSVFLALISLLYPRIRARKAQKCKEMPEAIGETYSRAPRAIQRRSDAARACSYEEARTIWNGMVAKKPGLIARCADIGDVQPRSRSPRPSEFSPQSGVAGIALLVSVPAMADSVSTSPGCAKSRWMPTHGSAKFAGGCLLGSIDNATQQAGLVFPSGVVSHTGASGLVLGGGTGWLTRRFGLSCDNVEGLRSSPPMALSCVATLARTWTCFGPSAAVAATSAL